MDSEPGGLAYEPRLKASRSEFSTSVLLLRFAAWFRARKCLRFELQRIVISGHFTIDLNAGLAHFNYMESIGFPSIVLFDGPLCFHPSTNTSISCVGPGADISIVQDML
jgi:hypothetical protein